MKRLLPTIEWIGCIVLLLSILFYQSYTSMARHFFMGGAALILLYRLISPIPRSATLTQRRLYIQRILAAVAYCAAGILMYTQHHNEWIVALLVGCVFEVYSLLRLLSIEKNNSTH